MQVYDFSEIAKAAKNSVKNHNQNDSNPPPSPSPSYALKFDSFFESGNLSKAYYVSGRSRDLSTITAVGSNGDGLSTNNEEMLKRLHPVDQEYEVRTL